MFRQAMAGGRPSAKTAESLHTLAQLGSLAQTIESYLDESAQRLLLTVLLPWAANVARFAPSKWVLPVDGPHVCAFERKPDEWCGAQAAACCLLCGMPVCVGHCLVAMDATVVCFPCMRTAAQHVKRWRPPVRSPGSNGDLAWAYRTLGVDPDADDQDVKRAYKKLVARYHPDRAGRDKEGAELDAKLFKAIDEAYAAVRRSRQK
jgi:hypothetical protein